MKNETEDGEWDKRRILIALLIAVGIIVGAVEIKDRFFPNKSILGQSTVGTEPLEKPNIKPPSVNLQTEVGTKINEIKQNIDGLDAQEIASSSPQIQKVLRDIQGIKDLPGDQAKEMCLKICSGI